MIGTDPDGNQTYYIYGLGLIGHEDSEGNYSTYHYDSRGSTAAITDIDGAVTDTFEYAPYGELVSRTGNISTPFLFNGREGAMTDNNGLYYMRARYYNPEIKRFINQDVIQGSIENGLSLNRYAYTNGNPISYIDPFGLSPLDSEQMGNGFNPFRKSAESLLEIGKDIYGGFVTKGDNAFVSKGSFADYITLGIPSGIYSGLKNRADIMLYDPSLYNIANWGTMGLVGSVKGVVAPEELLSKEHWISSFAVAATVVGKYKSVKTSMAKDGSLLTGGPSESLIREVKKDALSKRTSKVMSSSEAASKIANPERTGTALTKSDTFHRAASYVPENQLAGGKTFNITGGDGIQRILLQVEGNVNGKLGIFEYIIEPNGTVSHQLFKPGGIINGISN